MIEAVDLYVIFDTVQFTRRDWRTRNRIRVQGQPTWLTIPASGSRNQRINEVAVADPEWNIHHRRILRHAYRDMADKHTHGLLDELYSEVGALSSLSRINELLTRRLLETLQIDTEVVRAEGLPDANDPSERLARIAEAVGADEYWSGPSAKSYLQEDRFLERGLEVKYFDLSRVPSADEDAPYSIVHDLLCDGVVKSQQLTRFVELPNDS